MEFIRIHRLGAQGDGVSETGVFAPFTLPGETAQGAVSEGRMAAPEVTEPAPERASPPCPHFGACGGCALQHASDAFVAGWKRDQIAAALAARGVEPGELRDTATSPTHSRRRATFAARRTKKSAIVGFHGRRSGEIVEIKECHVAHPGLLAALPAIREAARIGASRKGEIRATVTLTEAGPDFAFEGGKALEGQALAAAAALVGAHSLARLSWNGETLATRAAPSVSFGEARVIPPPGGFLQATKEGEATLLAAVREAVGGARRIADLFSGCGTFALPLAATEAVHAVEGDAALIAALEAGARAAQGLKPVTAEVRDLFRRPLIGAELKTFDAVVIDPPRAGAAAQSEALAAAGPPVIAAVSCNPATFARDARALIDGRYRLDWVLPVDQFRWSPHIELAAKFTRA